MSPVKHSILIVDDDPLILKTLQGRFPSWTFDVHVATTPEGAQEEMVKYPPEIILLDVMLTKDDGAEGILNFMKSQAQFENVPVVVLTNLEQPEVKEKMMALGAREYLIKGSVSIDEIYDKVMNYLEPAPVN